MFSLSKAKLSLIMLFGFLLIACSGTNSQNVASKSTATFTPMQVTEPPIQPTPTPMQVKETPVQPTSTPIQPTETPVRATPTPEFKVLFEDDFEDESSGWEIRDEEGEHLYYSDGKYHVGGSGGGYLSGSNAGLEEIDDFSLEVDISHHPDYEVTSGIMFRYQDDDNFYILWQFYNGAYGLARALDGEITVIGGPSTADFIHKGAEENQLTLNVHNDEIAVFINDELVVYTRDDSFQDGAIKLYSQSHNKGELHEASFDNLIVTQISGIAVQVPMSFEPERLIEDDFDDDSSDWLSNWTTPDGLDEPEVSNPKGELHIAGSNTSYFGWHQGYKELGDFVLDVDVALAGKGLCQAGVVFRQDSVSLNGYSLVLANNGRFKLAENNHGEMWGLAEHSSIDYSSGSRSFNHITLKAVGPRIAVTINDELATFIYDNSLTKGELNLLAVNLEGEPCEIIFDNLTVAISEAVGTTEPISSPTSEAAPTPAYSEAVGVYRDELEAAFEDVDLQLEILRGYLIDALEDSNLWSDADWLALIATQSKLASDAYFGIGSLEAPPPLASLHADLTEAANHCGKATAELSYAATRSASWSVVTAVSDWGDCTDGFLAARHAAEEAVEDWGTLPEAPEAVTTTKPVDTPEPTKTVNPETATPDSGTTAEQIEAELQGKGFECGPIRGISSDLFGRSCHLQDGTVSTSVEFLSQTPTSGIDELTAVIVQYSRPISVEPFPEFLGTAATLPFIGQPELQEQARAWAVEACLATSGDKEVNKTTTIQGVEFRLYGQEEYARYLFVDIQD